MRGLVGVNRGLNARWGAARGLKGIVLGEKNESGGEEEGSGNLAVREWIGGGLKVLGEMIDNEEEENEGEKAELVDEILVSQFAVVEVLLSNFRGTDESFAHCYVIFQDVLKASLSTLATSSSTTIPILEVISERYGNLFGQAVLERWETKGGREIYDAVAGSPSEEDASLDDAMIEE